eukprot:3902594-Amphidinium_carterae.1
MTMMFTGCILFCTGRPRGPWLEDGAHRSAITRSIAIESGQHLRLAYCMSMLGSNAMVWWPSQSRLLVDIG